MEKKEKGDIKQCLVLKLKNYKTVIIIMCYSLVSRHNSNFSTIKNCLGGNIHR